MSAGEVPTPDWRQLLGPDYGRATDVIRLITDMIEDGVLHVEYRCISEMGEPMGDWDHDGVTLDDVRKELLEFDGVFPEGAPHRAVVRIAGQWQPTEVTP